MSLDRQASSASVKTLLSVSQHFVLPGHSLDDFGRSKIYIIDHNPSWKENQTKKREFLDPRVTNITSGRHTQKAQALVSGNFFLPRYYIYTTRYVTVHL